MKTNLKMQRMDTSQNWEMKLQTQRANVTGAENGLYLPQEVMLDLARLSDLETMCQMHPNIHRGVPRFDTITTELQALSKAV